MANGPPGPLRSDRSGPPWRNPDPAVHARAMCLGRLLPGGAHLNSRPTGEFVMLMRPASQAKYLLHRLTPCVPFGLKKNPVAHVARTC